MGAGDETDVPAHAQFDFRRIVKDAWGGALPAFSGVFDHHSWNGVLEWVKQTFDLQ